MAILEVDAMIAACDDLLLETVKHFYWAAKMEM
jgi:hypothetical protein